MDQKAFGAFIAELRRAEKLTQRQVADKLHVTDRAVSKWERGLSYPDVTLLEPLADTLGIGVGELLTCRRREPDGAEPEMPTLHSVLTITQEEKRLRTRRTRIIAIAAAAAAVVLAVLTTMQHNGALLYRQPTTAPNGSITLTVYRDRLLGGQFQITSDQPLYIEGIRCDHCGQRQTRWLRQLPLDDRLSAVDALLWSADSRYLLLCGTTGYRPAPAHLSLWDFGQHGEDTPIREREDIHLSILQ